jgi:hypothetical protein
MTPKNWRMLTTVGLLLGAIFLGGCAIDDVKAAKDREAKLLLAGQCAAGRGATNRMFKDEPEKLAAHDLLCDGRDPGRQPPTLDANTLDVIRALLQVPKPGAKE